MAIALGVFAHPDDMEIVASGTLLRLQASCASTGGRKP